MKFKKLLFGSAGIPISTPRPCKTHDGIDRVKKLGLGAMELEFVRSVNITEKYAPEVKEAAEKNGIILSSHGQYYINLSSLEKEKIKASIQRILKAARIAHKCGAFSCTFHAGFYQKQNPEKVYDMIKKNVKSIVKKLQDESIDIWIRPETTGKPTQWGSLKEILRLSQEVEQVMPCIDFAHLHARTGGKINTLKEFHEQLSMVEKALGKEALKNMHIHLAGIEYNEKGERHHLNLKDSDMNYKDLLKAWKEFKICGSIISESPNIEEDAIMLQKSYSKLK